MTHSDKPSVKIINQHGPMGFVMFTAFVGAFIYFLQFTNDFGDVLFAFIKAIVWPGFVIYHLLQFLGV
ncbi:MAG TPA: hypothetical protein VK497_01220 [Candidatus Saccharimonadales bacterium]|nr:hypothetical protein [Candidatus Saccharimonadales bacterium]